MVRQEDFNKDRRTKMATSSVNAPAKKDGAGGQFTWGGATDVVDYEPLGLGGMTKVETVSPVPMQQVSTVIAQPLNSTILSDVQQFPTLTAAPVQVMPTWGPGSPTMARAPPTTVTSVAVPAGSVQVTRSLPTRSLPVQTMTAVTQPVQQKVTYINPVPATRSITTSNADDWVVVSHRRSRSAGPETREEIVPAEDPATKPSLGEDMVRASVPAFDGQHPRNTFAKKPYTVKAGEEVQTQVAIDWSNPGTVAFQKQALGTNPAHLSPYAESRPAPSLAQLKAMPSVTTYIPKQTVQQPVVQRFSKPQVIMSARKR